MEGWLKQNFVGLLVGLFGLIGVYTTMQIKVSAHESQIHELTIHVKKLDNVTDAVPILIRDVADAKEERAELKPILTGLATSVTNLNITLVEFKGQLELSNSKLNNVKENQVKLLESLEKK